MCELLGRSLTWVESRNKIKVKPRAVEMQSFDPLTSPLNTEYLAQ